jgi:hypothetical protein
LLALYFCCQLRVNDGRSYILDPYIVLLIGFGCLVLLTSWLPMVLNFGGALVTGGLLHLLGWNGAAFGLIALLVVRPLSGWISMVGATVPVDKKAVISVYGIRGVGSIYLALRRHRSG